MTATTKQVAFLDFRLGKPQVFRNLCVIPIFGTELPHQIYTSLTDALAKGDVEVTEIGEGGSVPELKVINKGEVPVIIVDGEELIGAKQNRIVNTSILLAAHSELMIPVSCTESGRWQYNSRSFSHSDHVMASKARISKNSRLYNNIAAYQSYDAGQREVWNDVERLHQKLGTSSPSRAMSDAFEQKKVDIEAYQEAFPCEEGQKGIMTFLNGKLLTGDFLSRHDVYQKVHAKLLRSAAADAIVESDIAMDTAVLYEEAHQLLENIAQAEPQQKNAAVGLGEDFRYDLGEIGGAALVYQDEMVHQHLFRKAAAME